MTLHKSYPIASFKALPNEGEGTFEAIVSVIGNIDLQGDRVVSGAFDKSIDKWQKSGNPLPVLWSHDWGDPFAHIGYVLPTDMYEVKPSKAGSVPPGLYVKGHLDVDKPFAKQVYDLLAERRVVEWSFSYDIPVGGEQRAKDGANELLTVDVIEVGPTLKGANGATITLGTKSHAGTLERTELDPGEETQMKARLARALTMQLEQELQKAEWSGDRALGMCNTAADFRKIAFERANDSDPDTAAHWALPHHMGPNADANTAGVSAALAAINGARGGAPELKQSADSVRSHLEAHQSAQKAFEAIERWKAGDPSHLISWYNDGADGQIDWGSDGDWEQCVSVASQYMNEDDAKGFCELRHEDATGMSTSEHAHQEGKAKFSDDQPRDDHGRFSDGGGGSDSSSGSSSDSAKMPGTSITPDDARKAADDARKGSEGQDYGGAGASVIVGPDGEVVDASTDYYWAKETWRSAPEGSVMVEPDNTVIEGDGTTHPPKKASAPHREKAGRVIGAKAVEAFKQKLSEAVDAWADEVNGTASEDAPQEKTTDPKPESKAEQESDEKAFARGYGDGTAKREKASETSEYVRGYEEGLKDRAVTEAHEVDELNDRLASLTINTS